MPKRPQFTTALCIALCTALIALACSNKTTDAPKIGESAADKTPAPAGAADAAADTDTEEPPEAPPEGRPVQAWQDGKMTMMCESEARQKGFTIIDLSNYWVPYIFSERDSSDEPRVPNHFRPIFRKLANNWPYESRTMAAARQVVEHQQQRARNAKMAELRAQGMSEDEIRELMGLSSPSDTTGDSDKGADNTDSDTQGEACELLSQGVGDSEHFLEVFGIPPSLSVLRKRALDELERPCYADIDYNRFRGFDGFIAYRSNNAAKEDAQKTRSFAVKMRREIERLGLKDAFELRQHPDNKMSAGLIDLATRYEAISEAQKLLVCEGLFEERDVAKFTTGGLDWRTHRALVSFERKNRIFGWGFIGRDTLEALRKPPKERLYDTFMRTAAERVVDGANIIEDGTARLPNGKTPTYRDEQGQEHEVPNLVAEYTALLVKHMDLTSPDKLVAFLKNNDDKALGALYVAIPLPPRPPYYSDTMALHSVIHRGDVWYDYPYTDSGKERGQPRKVLPTNTLYVKWNDQDIPLITTNTTIGSWRSELAPDGYEYFRYKNSDVGPRIWKDIIAGPVWLPPDTSPSASLIKTVTYKGRTVRVPNYDEFGPWYASAYGLVAGFHYRPTQLKSGEIKYLDNGIRSHGSVDYNSILRRYYHGCHRLYNHIAIRLFSFILTHKPFKRVGEIPSGFARTITVDEEDFVIRLDSRGYKYELIDPVPVVVETGNIRGAQKTPIDAHMPKPNVNYGSDARFLPPQYAHLSQPPPIDNGTDTDTQASSPSADSQGNDPAKPSGSNITAPKSTDAAVPKPEKTPAATN